MSDFRAAWGERFALWCRAHFAALTAALWLWIALGLWFLGDKALVWLLGVWGVK